MACCLYPPGAARRLVVVLCSLSILDCRLRMSLVDLFMSVEPRDKINAHHDQVQVNNLLENARDSDSSRHF